jgi:RNA polymerase sporulation-specific sigma factor
MNYDDYLVKGDVDAILESVRKVCGIKLRSSIVNNDDHEDVTQEIVYKVFTLLDRYDKSRGKLTTYVRSIADTCIKDYYRVANRKINKALVKGDPSESSYADKFKHYPTQDNLFAGDFGSIDCNFSISELYIDIERNTEITSKELFVLKLKVAGYKNKEVAKVLKCTDARVCQLWSSVQKKIGKTI